MRDRAILELLYSSGLRVSEVEGLNTDDLNIREGLVKARGKGKKERIVPVGGKAIDAMKSYLIERVLFKKRKSLTGDDSALFLNKNGQRLTDRQIRRIVVKYARLTGIEGQVGPHTLGTHCHASADRRCRPKGDPGTPGPFLPVDNPEIYASRYRASYRCV